MSAQRPQAVSLGQAGAESAGGDEGHIEDPYRDMSKLELIQALRAREGGGGGAALQAQIAQLEVLITLEFDFRGTSKSIHYLVYRVNFRHSGWSWRPVRLRLSGFR